MAQEDKELLLKDLSARLPYGVKCNVKYIINNETTYGEDVESECIDIIKRISFDTYSVYTEWLGHESVIEDIKPYLRPMSSMAEEEKEELRTLKWTKLEHYTVDWLNAHHFDYRGLIEKGLAIEVTEENNPYKA
jgi:hypothetical protein